MTVILYPENFLLRINICKYIYAIPINEAILLGQNMSCMRVWQILQVKAIHTQYEMDQLSITKKMC